MPAKTEREYNAAIRTMVRAAQQWQRDHPHVHVSLNARPPGFPPRVALIGTLREAVAWMGANEATRQMLRAMDAAVPGGVSIIMAQAAAAHVFGEPS
jgi:hypothetical protein